MRNLSRNFTMRKTGPPQKGSWFRIENKDEENNTTPVYIYDEIGFWGVTAQEFVQELLAIGTDRIDLHLNSPGGAVWDGIAIYNALKSHPAEVAVYVDALAASAASFIAQSADEGLLYMTRNATMMIHDGIGICVGNADDMRETAGLLDRVSDNIADIYFQRAGGTVEEWRAFMQEEVWYNSFEAVEAGLADSVLGEEDKQAEEEKNKWDLSVFNHAGRGAAPSPYEVRERLLVSNSANKEASMSGSTATGNKDGSQSSGSSGQHTHQTAPQPGNHTHTVQPPAPASQPANTQPQPVSFKVNGQDVTDQSAVQTHINALETFRTETVNDARKGFVVQLSKDNKITASQVDKLQEFVLSLSPEQYKTWRDSWDSAPASSLFSEHGTQPTDDNSPASVSARAGGEGSIEDQIATLEQIVDSHRMTGMPEETLKNKESFKRLEALKAQQSKQNA